MQFILFEIALKKLARPFFFRVREEVFWLAPSSQWRSFYPKMTRWETSRANSISWVTTIMVKLFLSQILHNFEDFSRPFQGQGQMLVQWRESASDSWRVLVIATRCFSWPSWELLRFWLASNVLPYQLFEILFGDFFSLRVVAVWVQSFKRSFSRISRFSKRLKDWKTIPSFDNGWGYSLFKTFSPRIKNLSPSVGASSTTERRKADFPELYRDGNNPLLFMDGERNAPLAPPFCPYDFEVFDSWLLCIIFKSSVCIWLAISV